MKTANEIRQTFLDYFKGKGHQIVPSAPMVIKNDPTLMFTNAGMNQFKDIFLGNSKAVYPRVADSQKCLRVSGKHNDLEEVGVDTYHHTMFEMLGNWSFGDYFKKEAIAWAWELLTEVYGISKDRLYVTVFEGDKNENLDFDKEAYDFWKGWISEDRILMGNKKDNFWEMGETGPCGPCSEIHIDLRDDSERKKVNGGSLVNSDHPQVIEIWNNVFMQYNRLSDGKLVPLPAKHVDTGMGFERLCMALQGKKSNYDTDVFQPMIQFLSKKSKISYGADKKTDIAMRVMSDHIRAIAFAVADGQLPSNNKAGYVIRRILRRAVRYGYSFLNFKDPVLCELVPVMIDTFGTQFPELNKQADFIVKVIKEEELSFLRTLETGIKKFEQYKGSPIDGKFAFELFDTFGFPIDLTQLMARERNLEVDMDGFQKAMKLQKSRSKADATKDLSDWIEIHSDEPVQFVGYESNSCTCKILRYREVKSKGKTNYQIVLNKTPFYAESGGQVGDTGVLQYQNEKIKILDTQKENNLIVHYSDKLPEDLTIEFNASIDANRRSKITSNHSATHLLHAALKQVLGNHVAQKGSLVNESVTRFDFSHFAKVTDEEIEKIEGIVNEKIRANIMLDEQRNVPIAKALDLGATALFGEKYGDLVRVITFDPAFSIELCGGTHVKATGSIGIFKLVSESSVAAGVRRVEGISGITAENYYKAQQQELQTIKELLKNPPDLVKGIKSVLAEKELLQKQCDHLIRQKTEIIRDDLKKQIKQVNGINLIAAKVDLPSADAMKDLSYDLRNQIENLVLILGVEIDKKPFLSVIISDNLVAEKKLNASDLIRTIAKHIQGGGGGQPFFATAGGKNTNGIDEALHSGSVLVSEAI